MFRWQFSFRALLFSVLVVAVGLTALLSGSDVVANTALTFHFCLLGLGIVGAIARRGNARLFWTGYSVFGCGYSIVVLAMGQTLLTDDALRWVESLRTPRYVGAKVQAQWMGGSYYPATIKSVDDGLYTVAWDDGSADSVVTAAQITLNPQQVHRVGHAVLAPFIAFLGGLAAVFFFGERERPEREAAEPLVVE